MLERCTIEKCTRVVTDDGEKRWRFVLRNGDQFYMTPSQVCICYAMIDIRNRDRMCATKSYNLGHMERIIRADNHMPQAPVRVAYILPTNVETYMDV
jgi:hypothetical protein